MSLLIEAQRVTRSFAQTQSWGDSGARILALDKVSFGVAEGETLGIVGESGSGKTTLALILLDLLKPDSGKVIYHASLRENLRKHLQIIFQNPLQSLDPLMTIEEIVSEPLVIHRMVKGKKAAREESARLLNLVGLSPDHLSRRPHEFSGGQRQRIAIARALACKPRLLVLDEPLSSLDLTLQAQLTEMFLSLKQELGLTYIFITHNLALVKAIAGRCMILKQGRIVEEGKTQVVFEAPKDPYTLHLLNCAKGL
jgi:peptide/nickel transport system ATP-binding protein